MSGAAERLRELVELNRSIISTLDFDDVLERVVEKTAAFTGADACALLLVGDDGLTRVAASRGLDDERARDFAAAFDERINVALMRLLDFHAEDEFLGVPVIDHGNVRGLLAVCRRGQELPLGPESEEHYLVSALADQAAIALEHAVRYRTVSEENERHLRLLQAIQSNSSSYLAYLDADLRFVEANEGFRRALGQSAADLVGRRYEEVENAPPILPLLLAVRAGERAEEAQVRLRQIDGPPGDTLRVRPTFWKVGVRPVQDAAGGVEGLVISASDVTDEVMARKEVERANRRKDEFLAMLGHELRNPVAAIATAAEVMRIGDTGTPVMADVRDVVYRQVRHMARLLDDLLDVSRITRGTIELRKAKVDLRDVASLALESVRQSIEARGQELSVEVPDHPVELLGDKDRLVQVVSNLLANASRYTPPGGHLELSIRSRPGRATLRVRDDGEGIDAEDLPFLFEPFTQSKRGLDRPGGGLGLGLALVKQLAELHGGSVVASSAGRGLGSEFAVELPLPAALDADSVPAREEAGGRGHRKRRILVVEDNIDFAHNLAVLLQGEGHQVETVTDGTRALDAVTRVAPDLVLLDIGLPGMDGFELARRIRRLEGPAPVLVALSGYGDADNRRRARESGIDHYLVKPFWRERLWQLLEAS